jgi:hypothetical protein
LRPLQQPELLNRPPPVRAGRLPSENTFSKKAAKLVALYGIFILDFKFNLI